MSSSPAESTDFSRIDRVIDAPGIALAYERWLRAEPPVTHDYWFSEARARFEPRAGDVLRKPADLRAFARAGAVELESALLAGKLRLNGLSLSSSERALALIDGTRTLEELLHASGSARAEFERLLAQTFGKAIFAPAALSALEARISGIEIVRFVGSPYEIDRSYWENMADVRELAENTLAAPTDAPSLLRWLQRLHVVTLLGKNLDHFYRPASRISARSPRPGILYTTPSELTSHAGETLIVSGPRVGARLIGGETYHALLCSEDPGALADERSLEDSDGLPWGGIVRARAPDESASESWFLPPRPATNAHFERLCEPFLRARAGVGEALAELATFHYRFVRLHPFRCANQSLAMNLVNLLSSKLVGKTLPHSLLDQLALRMTESSYRELFARAVGAADVTGEAAARWAELARRKQLGYALIEELKAARTRSEALDRCRAHPDAARAALLAL